MKNIWTTYSPAFGDLIATIAKEKKIRIWGDYKQNICWEGQSGGPEYYTVGFCRVTPLGDKVTQGQFLDALMAYQPAPVEIKFNCNILGHHPILKDGKVTIGCQSFGAESINSFKEQYEDGMNSEPSIADCWTESSPELREYVGKIAQKYLPWGLSKANHWNFIRSRSNTIGGFDHDNDKVGDHLTPGQFIDRILAAKKPNFRIMVSSVPAHFDVSEKEVDAKSWGKIPHADIMAFFEEYGGLTKKS